jgi:hypothetical protein
VCGDDPELCIHGTCFHLPYSPLEGEIELPTDEDEDKRSYCQCSEGFHGRLCEEVLATCDNDSCHNEGFVYPLGLIPLLPCHFQCVCRRCVMSGGSPVCECSGFWKGIVCDSKLAF